MKHLHRLIVNSATYRLSSASSSAKNLAKDRDNRYWWRRKPLRLESQLVRDALLAHAGSLDPSGGGPSIATAAQNKSRRRSLYFFHSKDNRNKFLMVFDEAAVTECYRREQSVVPQQALALSHSQLVLEMAPQIAKQLAKGMTSDQDFVRKAFQTLLGMSVGDAEVSASVAALQKWQKLPMASNKTRGYFVWALINHNDFVTIR